MDQSLFPVVVFLYFFPLLVHLAMDSIRMLVYKKFVDHHISSWATATAGIPSTIAIHLLTGQPWLHAPISMLCLHFGLFSILLNIIRIFAGSLPKKWKSVHYLNSPSDGEQNKWDKILSVLTPAELYVLWALSTAYGLLGVFG